MLIGKMTNHCKNKSHTDIKIVILGKREKGDPRIAAHCTIMAQQGGTEPKIKIHHFSEVYMETPLYFQVLCMKDSYFVWAGTSSIKLDNMFVSVPMPYVSIRQRSAI
jgi:hypothetical protein